LESGFVSLLSVIWVDEPLHRAARGAFLAVGHRDLSLVDCVSFEVMRREGLVRAFSFDAHFSAAGFELVPART